MINRKTVLTMAVVATLAGSLAATGIPQAIAAHTAAANDNAAKSTQTTKETVADKDAVKVSDDATLAMHNVHYARLAIFDGFPGRAQTYLDAAVTRIAATKKDADKYAKDTGDKMHEDDKLVPFDAMLTVADEFVPTKDNVKHIAKANEHLKHGDKDKALETLKLGDVEVGISAQLVPVMFAEREIQEASKLVSEGKYYEANLALKALEDSIVFESYAIDGTPVHKAEAHS